MTQIQRHDKAQNRTGRIRGSQTYLEDLELSSASDGNLNAEGEAGEKFRLCNHDGSIRELSGGEAGLEIWPGDSERGRGEDRLDEMGNTLGESETGEDESERLGTAMVRFSTLRELPLKGFGVVSTSLRRDWRKLGPSLRGVSLASNATVGRPAAGFEDSG